MEEFIENFNTFRDYINNMDATNEVELSVIKKIRSKFDDLGLNDAF